MKKIIFSFSLFFVFIAAVRAQQISGTSTAEDCVNFINNVTKLNDGKDSKHNFIRTTLFTGGTFTETQNWTFSDYKNNFINIDWSDFEKLDTSKGDKGIYVYFYFKTEKITNEHLEIDNKTKLIRERKRKDSNSFDLYIAPSEESKIKELEAAAKRLSQIVVAKGNIFKTKSSTTGKIKNIEGKPSFEETVNYINTFLKDGADNILFCNTVKFKNREAIVGEHINGGAVYIISSYLWEGGGMSGYPQRTENYRIDLSKVEEIKIVRGEGFIGGCCQFGLWFVEKGNDATPKMHLPLWKDSNSTDNNVLKEQKIYKAFNHLRQLCGAPEPLSF